MTINDERKDRVTKIAYLCLTFSLPQLCRWFESPALPRSCTQCLSMLFHICPSAALKVILSWLLITPRCEIHVEATPRHLLGAARLLGPVVASAVQTPV